MILITNCNDLSEVRQKLMDGEEVLAKPIEPSNDIDLVISIPENIRVAITRMGLLRIPDEMIKTVDKAIQHGKPLTIEREENYERNI